MSRLRDRARRAGVVKRNKWFRVDNDGELTAVFAEANRFSNLVYKKYAKIGTWGDSGSDTYMCRVGFHTPTEHNSAKWGKYISDWHFVGRGRLQLWEVEVSGFGGFAAAAGYLPAKEVWRYMKIVKKINTKRVN